MPSKKVSTFLQTWDLHVHTYCTSEFYCSTVHSSRHTVLRTGHSDRQVDRMPRLRVKDEEEEEEEEEEKEEERRRRRILKVGGGREVGVAPDLKRREDRDWGLLNLLFFLLLLPPGAKMASSGCKKKDLNILGF